MIRRPPRSTQSRSSAASDVYKRQLHDRVERDRFPRPRQRGAVVSRNSFGALDQLRVGEATYDIFRLDRIAGSARLPYSLKVLLENLMRNEDGRLVTADQVRALAAWEPDTETNAEIQFTPARVLMQDFTGVPCVVDPRTAPR